MLKRNNSKTTTTTSSSKKPKELLIGDAILLQLSYFKQGIVDSITAWPLATLLILRLEKLRSLILSCFLLNLVLFIGSMYTWNIAKELYLSKLLQFVFSSSSSDTATFEVIPSLLDKFYYLLWVWPLFLLTFILNNSWYMEISEIVFQYNNSKKKKDDTTVSTATAGRSVSVFLADEVYRLLIFTVFYLETILSYLLIPSLLGGGVLSFVLTAFLYSYYSFEYKWILMQWPVENRLRYFEERYAYFLGFGLISALVVCSLPTLLGTGISSVMFPVFIVVGQLLNPAPGASNAPLHAIKNNGTVEYCVMPSMIPSRLRIFRPAQYIVDRIIALLNYRSSRSNAKQQ
ncbi:hypothetical protein MP638_006243 [Amoeboaphelidium occidentale]|nr:hypothetical protein MP638_006243 [Amoeboaphelidium occidentale]